MNTCGILCYPFASSTDVDTTTADQLEQHAKDGAVVTKGSSPRKKEVDDDDDDIVDRNDIGMNGGDTLEVINENSNEETKLTDSSSSSFDVHNNKKTKRKKSATNGDNDDDEELDEDDPPPIREILTPVSISSGHGGGCFDCGGGGGGGSITSAEQKQSKQQPLSPGVPTSVTTKTLTTIVPPTAAATEPTTAEEAAAAVPAATKPVPQPEETESSQNDNTVVAVAAAAVVVEAVVVAATKTTTSAVPETEAPTTITDVTTTTAPSDNTKPPPNPVPKKIIQAVEEVHDDEEKKDEESDRSMLSSFKSKTLETIDGKLTTPTGQLIDSYLFNMKQAPIVIPPLSLSASSSTNKKLTIAIPSTPAGAAGGPLTSLSMMMTPRSHQHKLYYSSASVTGQRNSSGNSSVMNSATPDGKVFQYDINPIDGSPKQVLDVLDTLECRNFDNNPTLLYLHLMKKEWNFAYKRILEHSNEISIWVYRYETMTTDGNNTTNTTPNKLRWKLLPIHAALIFNAPYHIINGLLISYPNSIIAKDDQGMLPIHLSVRMNTSRHIIEKLVSMNPDALNITDNKGRTPQLLAEQSYNNTHRDMALDVLYNAPKSRQQIYNDIVLEQRGNVETILRNIQTQHTNEVENIHREIMTQTIRTNAQKEAYTIQLSKMKDQYNIIHIMKIDTDIQLQDMIDINEQLKLDIASFNETKQKMNNDTTQLKEEIVQLQKDKDETNTELNVCMTNYEQLKNELDSYKTKDNTDFQAEKEINKELNIQIKSLEKQLNERCDSEQALAWQVAALAEKLELHNNGNMVDGNTDNDTITTMIGIDKEYIRCLEKEREELKTTVNKLSNKLYKVVGFLDEMVQEQESIVREALKRETEKRVPVPTSSSNSTNGNNNNMKIENNKTAASNDSTTVDIDTNNNNNTKASMILDSVPSSDRQKLVDNVSGMKNQIIAVIDSVIDSIPKAISTAHADDKDDEDSDEVLTKDSACLIVE